MKTRIDRNLLKIVSMLFLVNLASGIFYFSTSSLSPLIANDLHFTDAQLAVLFSIPSLGYAVLLDLPGRFVDLFSEKRSVILAYGLICLSGLLKIFSRSYAVFVVSTVCLTAGMVISLPASKSIIKGLNTPHFEKLVVFSNLGMTIGNWVSHTLSMPLADSLQGWRGAYAVYGIVMLALGSLCCVKMLSGLKNHQVAPMEVRTQEQKTASRGSAGIKLILMLLLFGVYGQSFAMNSWMPKMLTARGFDADAAGFSASLYSFGLLAVTIGITFFFPKLMNNKKWMAVAGVTTLPLLALIGLLRASAGIYAVSLMIGLAVGVQELYTQCLIVECSPKKDTAKFISAVYCAGNIGSLASINLIGAIPSSAFYGKIVCVMSFTLLFLVGCFLLRRSWQKT